MKYKLLLTGKTQAITKFMLGDGKKHKEILGINKWY